MVEKIEKLNITGYNKITSIKCLYEKLCSSIKAATRKFNFKFVRYVVENHWPSGHWQTRCFLADKSTFINNIVAFITYCYVYSVVNTDKSHCNYTMIWHQYFFTKRLIYDFILNHWCFGLSRLVHLLEEWNLKARTCQLS